MRVDKLKLPGKEGGCAAVEITMEEVRAAAQREGTQQPGEGGDRVAALEDLKGFLKAVLKLRNHKAFRQEACLLNFSKRSFSLRGYIVIAASQVWERQRCRPLWSKLSSFPVRKLRQEDISDDSSNTALSSNVALGTGCVCV